MLPMYTPGVPQFLYLSFFFFDVSGFVIAYSVINNWSFFFFNQQHFMIFRKKNDVEFMIVFISSIGLIFVWNTIFPMVRSGNLIYPGKIFVGGEIHQRNCNRDVDASHGDRVVTLSTCQINQLRELEVTLILRLFFNMIHENE